MEPENEEGESEMDYEEIEDEEREDEEIDYEETEGENSKALRDKKILDDHGSDLRGPYWGLFRPYGIHFGDDGEEARKGEVSSFGEKMAAIVTPHSADYPDLMQRLSIVPRSNMFLLSKGAHECTSRVPRQR